MNDEQVQLVEARKLLVAARIWAEKHDPLLVKWIDEWLTTDLKRED